MPRTVAVTIDAANLEAVRAALSAGTGLVLAAKAIEDLTPGKANPIVLDRGSLDELQRCATAFVDAIGELREPDPEPALEAGE